MTTGVVDVGARLTAAAGAGGHLSIRGRPFTMPAAVIMSHSRFISCGLLRSKEKPSTLVWRGDMISSASLGVTPRRGTAGFGISDDEKISPKLLLSFAVRPGAGERMKMRVLRSLVFDLSRADFLCQGGAFLRKATGSGHSRASFLPKSRMLAKVMSNVEEKHVNDFDEIYSNIQLVLTPRMKLGVLRLGAEMGAVLIWPSKGRRPTQYIAVLQHDLSESIRSLSDSILIRAQIQPGLYNSGLGHCVLG